MTSHLMILPVALVLLASSGRFKEAIKQAGSYNNEKESCPVRITISARGGFPQLQLPSHRNVVKDVTAIIMLENDDDATDFNTLRTPTHLYQMTVLGSGVRRVH